MSKRVAAVAFQKESVKKIIAGLDKKLVKAQAVVDGHQAHRDVLYKMLDEPSS